MKELWRGTGGVAPTRWEASTTAEVKWWDMASVGRSRDHQSPPRTGHTKYKPVFV